MSKMIDRLDIVNLDQFLSSNGNIKIEHFESLTQSSSISILILNQERFHHYSCISAYTRNAQFTRIQMGLCSAICECTYCLYTFLVLI